jgi:hydroxyethylthiazole kinase-like uncharacterized protein yjeF
MAAQHRQTSIGNLVVTSDQMRRIEGQMFDRGMPVAALMEKVAGLITAWIVNTFPRWTYPQVGVLAGPGHNGGDALVVARELWFRGYRVTVCCPVDRPKPLTGDHLNFIRSLGLTVVTGIEALADCDFWVDGLFGFGLDRPLTGDLAALVEQVNGWPQPIVSIDLPSGLHTDSGQMLGTAIAATHTLCLGLWKRAFCQSQALAYLGQPHLIDFDIPAGAITSVLSESPLVQRVTQETVQPRLPLPRPPDTHKYRVGHVLVIAGSRQFAGAALLAGLGARASGAGMVTLVVPESLRLMVVGQMPEALVLGAPETSTGAMAGLPPGLELERYDAIACGPGLSRGAAAMVAAVLPTPIPLLLDADGLNLLADRNPLTVLPQRTAPTLLTPHPGEFKRLFPALDSTSQDAGESAQAAARQSNTVILLKGACTAIAHPDGRLWYITNSTPALARGGSGDILTGLTGGLMAQAAASGADTSLDVALNAAIVAAWWHAQAAQRAVADRTQLGVDAATLATYLNATLAEVLP